MLSIKRVKYVNGYKLEIEFNTGDVKIVNLEHHLNGEIFEPLKRVEYFKTVMVNSEIDTIYWNNGADFAPEFLFKIGELKKAA